MSAPQVAAQQLVTHGAIPALAAMLRVPIPRDPSSCAIRACAAQALCPLALISDSRPLIVASLTNNGSEVLSSATDATFPSELASAVGGFKSQAHLG